jgi:hypothetical protein
MNFKAAGVPEIIVANYIQLVRVDKNIGGLGGGFLPWKTAQLGGNPIVAAFS